MDILLPLPVHHPFTYRLPAGMPFPGKGMRVLVPVGNRKMAGVAWGEPAMLPAGELRDVLTILDDVPVFSTDLVHLLEWAASYYIHPLGQVLSEALPPGLLSPSKRRVERIAKGTENRGAGSDLSEWQASVPERLSEEQEAALARILPSIGSGAGRTFLVHGVTGSGKTEIYLRAASRVLDVGKSVLVLVPEISMTTQTAGSFIHRFGEEVAVLHSGLTEAQRLDQWWKVRQGRGRVVVGTRSAVFAPVPDLGLIVVDEEHDPSYKQDERFRYSGRDLAVVRGKLADGAVVLGSATPSLTSYRNALSGKYVLVGLEKRVEGRPLPQVMVVDRRAKSQKDVNRPGRRSSGGRLPRWLSPQLHDAMKATLDRGEQALLFLNRRGFATFVFCPDCGHVFRCPRCEISLTWHRGPARTVEPGVAGEEGVLQCHYCGSVFAALPICPSCHGHAVRASGYGTERIADDVRELFPGARVCRLDRDTVQGKRKKMEEVIRGFHSGGIDVLVGTQMVTKGHDFPGLTLVGIVLADLSLNVPEFSSAERTFQLVSQVAGRAGRSDLPGKVVIQTWNPDHHAIVSAAAHDYQSFYTEETVLREKLGYPPFARMVNIKFSGAGKEAVEHAAEEAAASLRLKLGASGPPSPVSILGPSPAPLPRLKGKYRYHILLKSSSHGALRALCVPIVRNGARVPGVRTEIDVDPVQLL